MQNKGYMSLLLQAIQLKNYLGFIVTGAVFIPAYGDIKIWNRVEYFFNIWLIIAVIWLLLILYVYKIELWNRILIIIATTIKKIIPTTLFITALYLIIFPVEFNKTIGVLILLPSFYFFIKENKYLKLETYILNDSKKIIKPSEAWTATETNNPQGVDYVGLDLKKGRVKKLQFTIKANAEYWRAGFKIVNPNGSIFPLRSPQSILFHVGSTDIQGNFGITAFKDGSWVRSVNKELPMPTNGMLTLKFEVNDNNFLKCYVDNQVEFAPEHHINPRILEKAYIVAWGDGNPYRIEFDNINYIVRGENT